MSQFKRFYEGDVITEADKQNYNCYRFLRTGYAQTEWRIESEPFPTSDEVWIEICGGIWGGCRFGNQIIAYID